MEVTLLDHTPEPEYKIGLYASICYDSKTDKESCIRRAAHVVNNGHLACLRFAYATFNVKGVSRACSHQLVRHKFLDYLQRSQRYCKDDNAEFVHPGTPHDTLISSAYQSSMARYNELLQLGVKKEDARYVLPAGIGTELNVSGNFQAFRNFLSLRLSKHAQKEIRDVAYQVGKNLYKVAPNIFADFLDIVEDLYGKEGRLDWDDFRTT